MFSGLSQDALSNGYNVAATFIFYTMKKKYQKIIIRFWGGVRVTKELFSAEKVFGRVFGGKKITRK